MTPEEKKTIIGRMSGIVYQVLSAKLPLLKEVEYKEGEDRMMNPEHRKAVSERLELMKDIRDTFREVAEGIL